MDSIMRVGIVTGASRGLGLALVRALRERGWRLAVDARERAGLERATGGLHGVVPVPGDVTDPDHRQALVAAAGDRVDLVVNNASRLGPSPQPALVDYPLDELRRVYEANVLTALALVQLAMPRLTPRAAILNITSDAAVEPYEGWGGYGPPRRRWSSSPPSSPPSIRRSACTRSTPATCARRCSRTRFPERTSPTARLRRRAFRGC